MLPTFAFDVVDVQRDVVKIIKTRKLEEIFFLRHTGYVKQLCVICVVSDALKDTVDIMKFVELFN